MNEYYTKSTPVTVSREVGGRTLTFETGRMARQADGAVFASYGDSALLATAQGAKGRPGMDFFPLTVEYREKTYAAGKVPGGFFKREMRPRDTEILVMRAIDRPVRPLFPEGYRDEVQIIINVLSYDRSNETDTVAGCAAMAALSISSLPYQGPGATVRVGRIGGELVLNPTIEQMAESELDLIVSGTASAVTMVEAGAMELAEEVMAEAILFGHNEGIKPICEMITELQAKCGKPKTVPAPLPENAWADKVAAFRGALEQAFATPGKHAKKAAMKAVTEPARDELLAGVPDEEQESARKQIGAAFHDLEGSIERDNIIKQGKRADGRGLTEIRPIDIELGVLKRTHGSALFTRGETQALVTVTLGTGRDEQIIDGLGDEYSKRFMLHYNFPPFCVGEVRRLGSTSRREIGHGHLAERSVNMVMPSPEAFPYSARVVSEILESNGSSSMASVCGASLALMDAGCPLKGHVAGIAMGLIEDGNDHYILSDILGSEDHNGDMDFKCAGTEKGITALQMDIKIKGLSADLLKRALNQAREGRLHILGLMTAAIAEARPETSSFAPKLVQKDIDVEKIGALIGPGGKVIRALQTDYQVKIEVSDEGIVTIAAGPGSDLEGAVAAVEAICGDAEVGAIYKGKVVSLREFGAFIEIFPGKEGLLHISDASHDFVKNIHDVFSVGDEAEVKVAAVDDMGRVRLCLPDVDPENVSSRDGGGGRGRGARSSEPKEMPEVGKVYEGTVVSLKPYGAFVNILPGTDGLVHVSEMAQGRVERPEDVVSEGEAVKVVVIEVEENNRIRLSMKQVEAVERGEPIAAGEYAPSSGGGRGGRSGGGGRGGRPPRGR